MFYASAPVGEGHSKLPSVVRLSVRPSVTVCLSRTCLDLTREQKDLITKPKISMMEAHHTSNPT